MNYRDPQKNLKITQNLFSVGFFFYEITVKELKNILFCQLLLILFLALGLKGAVKKEAQIQGNITSNLEGGRREGGSGVNDWINICLTSL